MAAQILYILTYGMGCQAVTLYIDTVIDFSTLCF